MMEAGKRLSAMEEARAEHPDIYYAGFIQDAQKEYAEANATLALLAGEPLPEPEALGVEYAPYLHGLGEAVGELRRYLLDTIRRGDMRRCEDLLAAMDEIYGVLVTMDFPDAMTGGLRRTTDNVRGILERTRGDVTLALRQAELEKAQAALVEQLRRHAQRNPEEPAKPRESSS